MHNGQCYFRNISIEVWLDLKLELTQNQTIPRDAGGPELIHEKFGIFLDFETDSVKAEADNPLHARVEQAVKRAEEVLVLLSGYGEGG